MTIDVRDYAVRLGAKDFDDLVAGRGPKVSDEIEVALEAIREPALILTLTHAGPEVWLEHRVWVGEVAMGLLLALDEDRWQLMSDDAEALPVALVRATRTEPVQSPEDEAIGYLAADLRRLISADPAERRDALLGAAAGSAWQLLIDNGDELIDVWATRGDAGTRLYDREEGGFVTVTNSQLFRLFATILDDHAQRS